MDTAALKKIYATKTGKMVFDFLGTYKRNVSETQVPTVYTGLNCEIPEWELRGVLREIASAGAGTFIVGRKGHFSRIAWEGNMTEICAAVIDKIEPVTENNALTLTIPNLTPYKVQRVSEFLATL